jgi:hypothetical protein
MNNSKYQRKEQLLTEYINENILETGHRLFSMFYTFNYTYGALLVEPTIGFEDVIPMCKVNKESGDVELILLDYTQGTLREVKFSGVEKIMPVVSNAYENDGELTYGLVVDNEAQRNIIRQLNILGNTISKAESKYGLDTKEKYNDYISNTFQDGMDIKPFAIALGFE